MYFSPKLLLASCLLFIAIGSHAHGQRIPVEIVPWDDIGAHLEKSEIVVVGLLDSIEPTDSDEDAPDLSTPSRTLNHQMRKLRALGGMAIPGLDDGSTYSEKISILYVETNKDGEGEGEKANARIHNQKAKALYEMLGARPYVMENPMIFLIHNGRLVRAYGHRYHQPGREGVLIQQVATALLSPEIRKQTLLPEIVMMETLDLRAEKGDEQAIAYLSEQFPKFFGAPNYYRAYSYFWTEVQVRSGAEDVLWASKVFDVLFTKCLEMGDFSNAMQVVANVCSNLRASGRFGRLAEVMAVWEHGHRMGGNRMDISSYPDLGTAISCLPEIRQRGMPVTKPSQKPIEAGSNAGRFHVNDAGPFEDYAALIYAAGRWKEALEFSVWVRNWASDDKTKQPIGEYATRWYSATSNIIATLKFMGFQQEALEWVEEGLAAPHGQTYHGRWKILLAADHLDSLLLLDRAPSDIVEQFEGLIEKATTNSHINRSSVWDMKIKLAETTIKTGRAPQGEAIYDNLVAEGSLDARRSRLTHWIRSGRTADVEEELKDLLRFSRETGQKMNEYGLYRDYADFLERTGRYREALLMRREAVRLANVFGLFTHLPVEQSKLAVLLMRLGDKAGAAELADAARAQLNRGGLPQSVIDEINAHLAALQNLGGETIAQQQNQQPVDLQPHMSMVIPIADLPWTTYLTLINPTDQVKAGHLVIQGPSVEIRANDETEEITITLLAAGTDAAATQFACTVDPGTYRLIHLHAGAETKIEGEIQIIWQDQDSSSTASVKLEAPESGVGGAIIQAGEYRANPFYGVPMISQYVSENPAPDLPPLRFICSHTSRVEVYQLDGTPLAIDAQGNGSLLDQGDELFVKSDGLGNLILPLTNGSAAISLLLYPEKGIPEEGLTIDIEAFVDGEWQLYSRNRLAK